MAKSEPTEKAANAKLAAGLGRGAEPESVSSRTSGLVLDFNAPNRLISHRELCGPKLKFNQKVKQAAEIVRFQRLVGCGRRTRTSNRPVMSCGLDVFLAPLRALVSFFLGTEIRFKPLCSIGSVQFKSSMGHGLGQSCFSSSRNLGRTS